MENKVYGIIRCRDGEKTMMYIGDAEYVQFIMNKVSGGSYDVSSDGVQGSWVDPYEKRYELMYTVEYLGTMNSGTWFPM